MRNKKSPNRDKSGILSTIRAFWCLNGIFRRSAKDPDDALLFQNFFKFLDPLDASAAEIDFDISCEFLVHESFKHINDLCYLFHRLLLSSRAFLLELYAVRGSGSQL
jgi:hypothetical protein